MFVRNLDELHKAMELDTEIETIEFKQASSNYKLQDAARYCAAISNEGGGSLILGVTDKRPRQAIGTEACSNLDDVKKDLFDWLGFKIEVAAINAPKRVLSFIIPGRPIGRAVHFRGRYEIRAGSHLRPMAWEELERIRNEGEWDFSSNVIAEATNSIFDSKLVEKFRNGWMKKQAANSLSAKIRSWSVAELLETSGLTVDGKPTYAGLILLGDEGALNRLLPQSELIYEFRDDENAIKYQDRQAIRDGFLSSADQIWNLVKKRNHSVPYSEGLFKYNLPAFDEESVREAICNAVSHRDYRNGGSIFIRQSNRSIEVESPGGLPTGVTIENILSKSVPRNRRLAEAMDRCGLVERSGQGMDLMFSRCIMSSRPLPDLSRSGDDRVVLYLRSEITDGRIIAFFEQINAETLASFSGLDFLAVDLIRRKEPLTNDVRQRIPRLVDLGILEKSNRKFALSAKLLAQIGAEPENDRETIKHHLSQVAEKGASISEIMKLVMKDREQVRWLLDQMKKDGVAHIRGRTRGAKWYPGSEPN